MTTRREFVKRSSALAALGAAGVPLVAQAQNLELAKILCGFPPGRHQRRDLAAHRRQAARRLRHQRGRREQAGRRRPDRGDHAPGQSRRRQHHAAHAVVDAVDLPVHLSQAPLQAAGRPAAGVDGLHLQPRFRRRARRAGVRDELQGLPGLGQGQSRQGQLRFARGWIHAAHDRRCWHPCSRTCPSSTSPTAARRRASRICWAARSHRCPRPLATTCPTSRRASCVCWRSRATTRSKFVPDVPTFREHGLPITVREWYGLFLPAKASAQTAMRAAAYVQTALVAAGRRDQHGPVRHGGAVLHAAGPRGPAEGRRRRMAPADQADRLYCRILIFNFQNKRRPP